MDIERFWRKVNVGGAGECWEWNAGCFRQGYGQFYVGPEKHAAYAHRVSWEIAHGAIPAGLFVLHRCDNRPCVNPAHLFLGTFRDNIDDMVAKGRQVTRGRSPHTKITPDHAVAIREVYATGEVTQWVLAKHYGVNQSTIQKILRR